MRIICSQIRKLVFLVSLVSLVFLVIFVVSFSEFWNLASVKFSRIVG
jgi:hypothetical protein